MGNLNQAEVEYFRAYERAPPQRVKSELEEVRRRLERQSRVQPSATPKPWP